MFRFQLLFALVIGLSVMSSMNVSGKDASTEGIPPNQLHKTALIPSATNVTISGNLFLNQTLTGNYTYADDENDPENGSTFQWYRFDDNLGSNRQSIAGATLNTYQLTSDDVGKFISFEVNPNDGNGFGAASESAIVGVIFKESTVQTISTSSITATTVTISGNVTDDGGNSVSERGFVLSTIANPTINDTKITSPNGGLGNYSEQITGLNPNQTYFVRAYSQNQAGVSYGNELSFSTLKQEVTISGSFSTQSKVYDGTLSATISANNLSLSGVLGVDDVSLTAIVVQFQTKTVANGKIVEITSASLQGVDAANYTLNLTNSPTSAADITSLSITVNGSFSASDKVYDGTTASTISSNNLSLVGILGADNVQPGAINITFDSKTVGNGKTVSINSLQLQGADASNYQVDLTGAPQTTASISVKIASIGGAFTAKDKTYDGTQSADFETNTLFVNGGIAGDDVQFNTIALTFSQKNVGSSIAVSISSADLTGNDASNYSLTLTGAPQTIAAILVKDLTLGGNFSVQDKVYDGLTLATINSNAVVLNGKIGADDVTINTVVADFDTKLVGSSKTVNISSVSLQGSDSGNYTLSLQNAPFTQASIFVKSIQATGRFTVKTKSYDATLTAELETDNLSLSGIISGDDVSIASYSIQFADASVGSSKTVSISDLKLQGVDAANYSFSLNGAPTSTGEIQSKQLTVNGSFTANNKLYDATDDATIKTNSLSLVGVISGESVQIASLILKFDSAIIGIGKTVRIHELVLGGLNASNYSISLSGAPTATATIFGKQLQLLGSFKVDDKVYDASTDVIVTQNTLSINGVETGDDVVLDSVKIKFQNRLAEVNKIVIIDSVYLSGADASNYGIDSSTLPTDTATIFPKTLQINSVQVSDKEYDGTDLATILNSGELSGFIGLETVSYSSSLTARFESAQAGNEKNVFVTSYQLQDGSNGGLAQNYTLLSDTVKVKSSISKKNLTITANDSILIYTGVPFTGGNGVVFDSFVAGEDSTDLDGKLSFTGNSQGAVQPGKYILTPTGFSSENYSIQFISDTLTIYALPVAVNPKPDTSAQHVALNSEISVGFSIPVFFRNPDSIYVTEDSVKLNGYTVEFTSNRLVFSGIQLDNDKLYNIAIKSGTVISSDSVVNAPFEWQFRTIVKIPEIPILAFPVHSDSLVETDGIFSWLKSDRAVSYDWQVSTADNFSSIVRNNQTVSDTTTTATPVLSPLQPHWWRVRAENYAGFSEWSETRSFVTKAAIPELVFPDTNQINVSTAPLLKWQSLHANVSFDIQISRDSLFNSIVIDSSIISTEMQLWSLKSDTTYFWRVKLDDVRGSSDYSEIRKFQTRPDPSQVEDEPVKVTFTFGSSSATGDLKTNPSLSDYRMISLPGADYIRMETLFGGAYDILWRAFYETGQDSNYYAEFTRGDDRFVFAPGRGFWVLSTEAVVKTKELTPVQTDSLDAFPIQIHSGWNIIGNPFQKKISWNQISQLNRVSGDIWGFSSQFERSDSLEPFKGYYFYNSASWNLDTLKIPYTSIEGNGRVLQNTSVIPDNTPKITATASYDDGRILDVNWIYAQSDELGFEVNKVHPELTFVDKGMILSSKNDGTIAKVQSSATYDPNGTAYDLEIKARVGSVVNWKASMKNMPNQTKVLLINKTTKKSWIVGNQESIELEITEPTSQYEVYIGDESALSEIQKNQLPDEIELMQNYPNPFNPTTVIRFALPQPENVKIEVFDVLGRKVATLINKEIQAGWHSILFNPTALSSGMYLYRMQAGSKTEIRKMLFVK